MSLATRSPSVDLFAYPWDILDTGVAEFVDHCASLGVNGVHATACYHSGKFLLPRNTRRRIYFPEPGCVYFPPPAKAFEKSLEPPVSNLASTRWYEQLAKHAATRGIRLTAWTVFFHSSFLGQKYPELTARNLFGDSYPFALCPSHKRVQDYAADLCRSIESLGTFAAIDLETIGYLGYFHGYHHEVNAVPLGTLEKFILSLCFCDACQSAGQQAGIQMEILQKALRKILIQKLSCDDASSKNPQNAEQVATLLAMIPEIHAFLDMRCATISGLVARLRQECTRSELNVFTSSFVGSPSNIWMEGINLTSISDLVERCAFLAYSSDPDLANDDLLFCLSLVNDAKKLEVILNLGLPVTPSLANASAIVEFALKQGIRKFAFFNYGFLGHGRLEWIRELSKRINDFSDAQAGAQ